MQARAVTKWNTARDNILARLASFSTTRNITDDTVLLGTRLRIPNLDCFRTHLLSETYKIRNQLQAEYCAHWDHKHVPQFLRSSKSKQPHARLRIEGTPTLQLWDWKRFYILMLERQRSLAVRTASLRTDIQWEWSVHLARYMRRPHTTST